MAVEAVELDEVGEGQAAVLGLARKADQMLHQFVVRSLGHIVDAAHREDVADLADGMNRPPGLVHPVAERRRGRRDGEVAAVRRCG